MPKLKNLITIIFFILFCLQQTAWALDIPIIVIAPNKSPKSYSSVGSSVSIIDQETIENSNTFF